MFFMWISIHQLFRKSLPRVLRYVPGAVQKRGNMIYCASGSWNAIWFHDQQKVSKALQIKWTNLSRMWFSETPFFRIMKSSRLCKSQTGSALTSSMEFSIGSQCSGNREIPMFFLTSSRWLKGSSEWKTMCGVRPFFWKSFNNTAYPLFWMSEVIKASL